MTIKIDDEQKSTFSDLDLSELNLKGDLS